MKWKEDHLTMFCEKGKVESVKVTSRIIKRECSSAAKYHYFYTGLDLRRAEDSYFLNISCWPIHSPKGPRRKGILSIL